MLALTYYSIAMLSAGTTYIRAEGHYSKAQKDAVFQLVRYAQHRDEASFARYQAEIAVPLGDQLARLEFNKASPDLGAARAGFLQGNNRAEDIDGMLLRMQRFRNVDYVARAIELWAQADQQINLLQMTANALRAEALSPTPDETRILALAAEVDAINDRLTPLETGFSAAMGEAQRRTLTLLFAAMGGAALLLLLVGVLLSRRILRQDEAVRHELRESAARFRSLTELSTDWYWEQDREFRFTEISSSTNAEINRLLALSIGKTRWEVDHLDVDPVLWQQHQAQLERHEPFSDFEVKMRLANGEVMTVRISGDPMFDDAGRFCGYRGVGHDNTETRRAEGLRAAKEAAELANRSKSAFLSRMSHELRTPLNAVLGFAQLLEFEPGVRESGSIHRKVENIQVAGNHLLEMVNEILDLSRIESGTAVLSIAPVEIGAVIAECVAMTRPQADQLGITLDYESEQGCDAGHWISGDRTRLLQIAINVVSNAVKYNRNGGSVYIDVGGDAQSVVVIVRDTGFGLSAEQRAGLFQPFNRLGAEARVGGAEGTGLGLVISKQLTEVMHGSIEVTSQPGEGSRFTLSYPRIPAPADAQPAPLAKAGPAVSQTPLRSAAMVLYVEDNPVNVDLVRDILRLRPQVRLEVATDGPAGLAAALRLLPDAILLDINLPGMDGIAVIQQLRSNPLSEHIPCMAVSANAMPAEVKRASDAGFNAYVVKPIRVDDFLLKFDALLASRSGSAVMIAA